ncbi:DUF1580 domain-containing protein [Stieleria maiorica]|uniref:DUF1580 domain-containing protein n=1 Tax=Stieleria maiorica TaxID=2795974 RepID=UPI00142F37B7|nr:DUF1580 domain-containing protein [Stieleria maiorica]
MNSFESSGDATQLLRLSKAVSVVERITGERPHVASLHRWAARGLAGCKLRTVYAAGCRRTSALWIREFFDAVTAAKSVPGQHSSSAPQDRDSISADAELKKAGI